MPLFAYTARTKQGEERSGVIETSSEEAVLETLHRANLVVVSIKQRTASFLTLKIGGGIRQKDIVIFSRQLSILFEAQIPAVYALKTLAAEATRTVVKNMVEEIADDVNGGMALSQALAKHPNAFSPFFINLVRSGEETGKLQQVFTYLADYLERSYYLTMKARNAMIYPAFVLTAFMGVVAVMLVVVIPNLVTIFEEMNQTLPFYTAAIIAFSKFLRQWGIGVLIGLMGGAIFLWRWSKTEQGKAILHKLQLTVPLYGDIYKKLYMARLTDNLRTLIMGGIPLIRALTITGDVVGNVVYKRAVEQAIQSVKAGSTISMAFERSPAIPVLVTQMIRIGETSGKLDFILGNLAKFYQREVDSVLENLVSLVEPALIIFLGIAVGILVAAVLMPLYNLVGTI